MDDRILQSILRILVETYQQEAAHTLLLAREADLREADQRIKSLSDAEGAKSEWRQAVFGIVGSVGALFVRDPAEKFLAQMSLPPEYALYAISAVIVLSLALVVWGALDFVAGWAYRSGVHRRRRALKDVRQMYWRHSDLNERLQYGRQTRVAEEALLLPYDGMTWEQVARTANVGQVRKAVNEIAKTDANQHELGREYRRCGGEYWHELLRETLRGRLSVIVCRYVEAALTGLPFDEWRAEALKISKAEAAEDDPTDPPHGAATFWSRVNTLRTRVKNLLVGRDTGRGTSRGEQIRETIHGIGGFSLSGLQALVTACRDDSPGALTNQGLAPPPEFSERWVRLRHGRTDSAVVH